MKRRGPQGPRLRVGGACRYSTRAARPRWSSRCRSRLKARTPAGPRRRHGARSPARRWPPARARCARAGRARCARRRSRRRSRPSRAERLRAHAGERRLDVVRLRARARSARRRARTPSAARRGAARSRPVRHQRASIRHVPGQASVSSRSRRRTRREAVGVARARHQRGRPDQHLAVDVLGQVDAEERQRRVGHGVDQRAHELRGARAPAAGRRRGRARSAGRGRRPRRPPGGRPRRRRRRSRGRPRSRRARARAAASARPTLDALDLAAGGDGAARLEHVARRSARATARKSTMPVSGECSPAIPRACGSSCCDAGGVDPAQAGHAVGPAAPLELVEPRRARRGRSRRSPSRSARSRCRAARSTRTSRARPRRTAAPSASRARSRRPRGSRPSCGRSGALPTSVSRSSTHTDARGLRADQLARDRQPHDPAADDREVAARRAPARGCWIGGAHARNCSPRRAIRTLTPAGPTAPGPPGAVAAAAFDEPGAVQPFVAAAAELASRSRAAAR